MRLEYGHCPKCDQPCQPEYSMDDDNEESVTCCDCRISWTLHHDDPNDKWDNTEPWRTYRISDIQDFDDMLIEPPECSGDSNIAD